MSSLKAGRSLLCCFVHQMIPTFSHRSVLYSRIDNGNLTTSESRERLRSRCSKERTRLFPSPIRAIVAGVAIAELQNLQHSAPFPSPTGWPSQTDARQPFPKGALRYPFVQHSCNLRCNILHHSIEPLLSVDGMTTRDRPSHPTRAGNSMSNGRGRHQLAEFVFPFTWLRCPGSK